MLGQALAIIRNSFFEAIRQPILLVVVGVATIALVFCNQLAAFTMEDDQRMMIDLGLSTVFISGTLLAAFIATNVLNREIENRTALTVISKPVGRPLFVLGKYLGVAGALVLATAYLGFVFLLVEMHGVQQTVRDPTRWNVIGFGLLAVVLAVGVGLWSNYFYDKVFSSTAIVVATPLLAVAWVLAMLFDKRPAAMTWKPDLLLALAAIVMAILVLTSVAIAASTRLGQVMTLSITLGVLLLGLLSDWLLGRPLAAMNAEWLRRAAEAQLTQTVDVERVIALTTGEVQRSVVPHEVAIVPLSSMADGLGERLGHLALGLGYAIVPNFQVFFLSDAVTQNRVIPPDYIGLVLIYGPLQITVALSVAVLLFQRREVG